MRPTLRLLSPLLLGTACASGMTGPPPSANADEGGQEVDGEAFDWPALSDVDAEILEIMESDHVPGLAACIVEDEQIVWCQGYGWASVAEERPARSDTPFLLASVSKVFTQTALVQAAEAGQLDLDEDVSTYLGYELSHPAAPNKGISSRMLAAHAGGIADNWDLMEASYTDGADSPIELSGFMESYLRAGGSRYDEDNNFTWDGPGETSEYSNIGAALTAQVLADATGTPFPSWCQTRIFTPLGMDDTAWFLSGLDQEQLAVPTEWWKGGYEEVGHYGFPDYPSGQLRSSAVDVARFLRVAMGGGSARGVELLSASAQAEMLEPAYPALDPDQGLGWYRWDLDGDEVWGHNGGESGASTEILWWPETGRGVVALMNAEGKGRTLGDVERVLRDAELP